MDDSEHTLAWIFGIRPPKGSDKRLDASTIAHIREAVVAAATALGPTTLAGATEAADRAVSCVADALESRLTEIVVTAWNQRKEIAKYADTTKYPPGKKQYVQLYQHPITWTYRPYLEITVRGIRFTVELEIVLKFVIDQAVLVIDGGRVMAIEPGKVKAEGSAKIGRFELCPPIKKELGELPGSIPLGSGIPLKRSA